MFVREKPGKTAHCMYIRESVLACKDDASACFCLDACVGKSLNFEYANRYTDLASVCNTESLRRDMERSSRVYKIKIEIVRMCIHAFASHT